TFAFYLQATDLTVTEDATRQVLQAGPGGQAMLPVKHSIPFLKPRHEVHGGPKEPKRWEWIQLPLPAFTASGLKVVRIVTEQKGFAFAAAVASAVRTREPGESDLKGWVAERADVPEVVEAAPPDERDPALVGHWKLDEPSGAAALDASGHDHTAVLTGDPPRGPGKSGGALLLDGKDRYATIPSTAVLDRLQEGAYTISAWYRPNSRPAGKEPSANDSSHAIVMKAGLHEGLRYGNDLKFSMDHWLADDTGAAAVSNTAYPPGTFYHVAGVVNRLEGTVRLYVNGRLEGVHMWSPQLSPRAYGRAPWTIGIGAPGAAEYRWAADGAVDDVRLYNRALNAQEIRALAGGTTPGALPSIALTAPGPGETYAADSTLTLSAEVSGLDKVQRVDFLLGTTVIASDTAAPFTATWARVPAGMYTLVARATVDRSSPPLHSKPVTVRVGEVELFRAINLGGVQAVSVDGVPFEPGSGAPNLAVNGQRLERRDLELDPPADAARATLLRSSLTYRDGAIVTLKKMPAGTYQIYLYVWEDNESTTYDVVVEDKTLQARYVSGPPGTWTKLGPWTVDVVDEGLTIGVRGGPANFSALEVWKVTR
ncbi:MAG TPA: LamG-like jellyroll fold domain-containing protein, partial [Planctomycetota bacterium]|nr:LamG-like jellyroll fold domain-containing protein [Planctomycetota bacterium]